MEQSSLPGIQSAMQGVEVLYSSEGKFNFFIHRIPLERPESTLSGYSLIPLCFTFAGFLLLLPVFFK